MPIVITPTCKHCSEPIAQDDYFRDWFHTGRGDAPNDMICTPGTGPIHYAEPTLTVKPRVIPGGRR